MHDLNRETPCMSICVMALAQSFDALQCLKILLVHSDIAASNVVLLCRSRELLLAVAKWRIDTNNRGIIH